MSQYADILAQFLEAIKEDIITDQEKSGKVATGNSILGYGVQVKEQGPLISGSITAVDYWDFIENGRGPGQMPPESPIRAWAEAKGILNTKSDAEKNSIIFLIRRAIGRNGTINRRAGLLDSITQDRFKAFTEALFTKGDQDITQTVKRAFE